MLVLVLVLVLEVVEPISLIECEHEYDDEHDLNTLLGVRLTVVSHEHGLRLKKQPV